MTSDYYLMLLVLHDQNRILFVHSMFVELHLLPYLKI